METDPRHWIAALRASHDALAGVVASLDDEGLTTPSMCREWTVAQVLSHLGSGAEIGRSALVSAIGGAPTIDA
ncbi:MAG TPA: maleylpyruvate isomerase N-terminal domain-containing protein, partial [Ilumatobacteraceae bacterium]|nr:maleylpyruvate isomerase N-terminal domain-containing protein [Ilumatobacteraceae bacterium]